MQGFTDITGINPVLHKRNSRAEMHVLGDHEHSTEAMGCIDHRVGIFQSRGDRFLYKNVLPGSESHLGCSAMIVCRKGQDDGLDTLILQRRIKSDKTIFGPHIRRKTASPFRFASTHKRAGRWVSLSHQLAMKCTPSRPYDADRNRPLWFDGLWRSLQPTAMVESPVRHDLADFVVSLAADLISRSGK